VPNSYIKIWDSHSGSDKDTSFLKCWLQHLGWYAATMRHGITSQKTSNYAKITQFGPPPFCDCQHKKMTKKFVGTEATYIMHTYHANVI
jgi:hypothetical protein